MALKKIAVIDPTWPFTEIEVDGVTYKMVFSYGALAVADAALSRNGFEGSVLSGVIQRTFFSVRDLFAASLYAYHPELDFNAVRDWVTAENIVDIVLAIDKAWKRSTPEPVEANPPQPEA